MTDPFSITVGIVGLLSVAGKALTLAKDYHHEVKHGNEAVAELLKELDVLYFNLSRRDVLLERENGGDRQCESISVLVTSTNACRIKLNVLYDKLVGEGRSHVSRLKWPLSSKEHRETIQELRAFAQ